LDGYKKLCDECLFPILAYVAVPTLTDAWTLLQVIIMLTPVNTFFTVYYQSWHEWLFAIGVAAGCMLVSLLVKLISRYATKAQSKIAFNRFLLQFMDQSHLSY